MSETNKSALPSLSRPDIAEAAPVLAQRATPHDGRTRVLCPAGLGPSSQWPAGRAPLMAYVIYSSHPNQA